jgi:hypothetical protein
MSAMAIIRNLLEADEYFDTTGYTWIIWSDARHLWNELLPDEYLRNSWMFGDHEYEPYKPIARFSNGAMRYRPRDVIQAAIHRRRLIGAHDCFSCGCRLRKPVLRLAMNQWFCSADCHSLGLKEAIEWEAHQSRERRALSLAKRQLRAMRQFLKGHPEALNLLAKELPPAKSSRRSCPA